jgi:hypothetical protein
MSRGDILTDPVKIATIMNSEHTRFVVRVSAETPRGT